MTDAARSLLVTLLALAASFALAWTGKLTAEWGSLAAYMVGLHAGGTAAIALAKPAGEYLAAQARAKRQDPARPMDRL